MQLQVNGEERAIGNDTTLAQLLEELGFGGKYIAVERNKAVVPFRTYNETVLHEGDCLEIVTLVGGG